MKRKSLRVKNGISPPSSIDPNSVDKFLDSKKKELKNAEYYIEGIKNSDITILSKSITLLESSLPEHQALAQRIIEGVIIYSGRSCRVGITGVPGVGKSSFIEALGKYLIEECNKKLAILAIDPSSSRSKGSILGDKTRMEFLSAHPRAFIRPSPTSGALGGVAAKTREAIIMCEAAGFDTIFVETVGVGQSETMVHSMVDFFLLLMLAGAGDELQGIKRGIMEMADALVITKSDGSNIKNAQRAKQEYENALHLFPPSESGWSTCVLTCSAHKNEGINDVWQAIADYLDVVNKNGYFEKRRKEQMHLWMFESIDSRLQEQFYQSPYINEKLKYAERKVLQNKISPAQAAQDLLELYFSKLQNK